MDGKKVGIVVSILAVILIGIIMFFVLKKDDITYQVTFKNETLTELVEVKENDTVSKPSDPEKEGYTFEGWYYDGTKFDFTTEITEDIILEARWTKDSVKKFVVTFNTNGGEKIDSLNVEEGKVIIDIPEPTKEGYTFEGWYYNNERFNFNTAITKDITLVANWKQEEKPVYNNNTTVKTTYTVTFDSQSGTAVSSQRVEKNKTVVKPSDPKREGYRFLGWYLNNAEYDFSKKVTNNIVLTAKWEKVEEVIEPEIPNVPEEANTYTVTFATDGGSSISSQKVEEGKLVTKPSVPEKEGYKFIGWYLNNAEYDFKSAVTKDITLTAKWEKTYVITYKIEETDSYVGQVILYVLKDGEKVDGIVDITTVKGTTAYDKEIPKEGYITNGDVIKTISNVRVK